MFCRLTDSENSGELMVYRLVDGTWEPAGSAPVVDNYVSGVSIVVNGTTPYVAFVEYSRERCDKCKNS